MPRPRQRKLPGSAGPPQLAIERRERLAAALATLDEALWPTLEELPPDSRVTLEQTIKGTRYTLTIRPQDPEARAREEFRSDVGATEATDDP